MPVQQQCAVTAQELLTWEEPRLAGTILLLPLWLSHDFLRSYIPPASQRCCYCFPQRGSELSQHFWCFHIRWPFLFCFLTWRQDCDVCTFEKCWLNSLPASGASCYCSHCPLPSYTGWSTGLGLFQQCYFQRPAAQQMLASSATSQLIFPDF